jgi:hypothetical protein
MRMRPILIGVIVTAALALLASTPTGAQAPAPAAASSSRLTDNGNETISDSQTLLMWEKKTTAVGSGENLRDPRDVDNTYTWDYAVGDWIDKLNGRLIANANDGAFAAYTDWRVPTLAELQTIVDPSVPTRINAMFGANAPAPYWSASRRELGPSIAWYVLFGSEIPVSVGVPFKFHVRAVRGGRR